MDAKWLAIFISLLIALLISISVSYLVIFKIPAEANQALCELYEIYVVSGFLSIWLIVLAVLRYALSKRHTHNAQFKEYSQIVQAKSEVRKEG